VSTRAFRKEFFFGFPKSINKLPQCSIRIARIQIPNMVEKQSPKHYDDDDDDATFGLNWEEFFFHLNENYCLLADERTDV